MELRDIRVGGKRITLTHLDKVLFPQSQITKAEILSYYVEIAPWMIPLMKNRPVSLLRFPTGITGEHFYQKNTPDYFPSWIPRVSVARSEQGHGSMLLCNNAATLIYLANQNCLTLHLWLSQVTKPRYPDRMIFDFDPSRDDDFVHVMNAAREMADILEEVGLVPFVMTTGSRGLHVVVPLKPVVSYDQVRLCARRLAGLLVTYKPDVYTIEHRKDARHGKIFVDYLRNGYAATAVAPYAVRAIEGAPVAMPLSWDELRAGLTPQTYTIKNALKRVESVPNPWQAMQRSARSLTPVLKRVAHLYERFSDH